MFLSACVKKCVFKYSVFVCERECVISSCGYVIVIYACQWDN